MYPPQVHSPGLCLHTGCQGRVEAVAPGLAGGWLENGHAAFLLVLLDEQEPSAL